MTGDSLSRLFDAERAVQPPPHALEQGVSRLLTDLAQHVAPLPVATGSLKLGVSLVSKWLVVGFVVGVGGAGAASQVWAPEAVAAVPAPSSSALHAARVGPLPAPAEPLVVPAEVPTEPAPAVAVHSERPAASVVEAPTENATTFDAELRLITAAKSEIDKGRPQLAAAWLSEHAERFPGGVFSLERDALRILVRCSQSKDPSAARAFAERHPASPMVDRLLRACTPQEPAAAPSAVEFPQ
jgi:hypothetical protein